MTVRDLHNYLVGGIGVVVHNGITCKKVLRENLKATGLKATQSAKRMDWDKIDDMAKKMEGGTFDWAKDKFDKIIVDKNGVILDGHHRVVAAQKAGVAIPESAIHRTKDEAQRTVVDWDDVIRD